MWYVSGYNLQMAEADFGLALPVTVTGAELRANDTLRFTFKTAPNGETVLTKEYTPQANAAALELTEAESALFSVGEYVYSLDWYQSGVFMCNIIPVGTLKVVDKA